MQTTLILGSLCLVFVQINGQGQPQHVQFYNTRICTITPARYFMGGYKRDLNVFQTTENLSTHPQLRDANSFTLVGMWRIYEQNGEETVHHLIYSKDDSRNKCHSLKSGHVYTKVEKFGGNYLNEIVCTLYTEERFHGVPTVTNFVGELQLGQKTVIRSWLFTGNNEWTVYEDVDFMGHATCLRPNRENLNQYSEGITYELETQITVGSARIGCPGSGSGSSSARKEAASATILLVLMYLIALH